MSTPEFEYQSDEFWDQADVPLDFEVIKSQIRWTQSTFDSLESRLRTVCGEPAIIPLSLDVSEVGWLLPPTYDKGLIRKLGFFIFHTDGAFEYALASQLKRAPIPHLKNMSPTMGGLIDVSCYAFEFSKEDNFELTSLTYSRHVDAYDENSNPLIKYPWKIIDRVETNDSRKITCDQRKDLFSFSQLRFNGVRDLATEFSRQIKEVHGKIDFTRE